MSITFNRARQRWHYQFESSHAGRRQRTSKLLPAGWTKAQALEFDRVETARLASLAAGLAQPEALIEHAVLLYLQQHAPTLKNYKALEQSLALLMPAYAGLPISSLASVARSYATQQTGLLAPGTIKNRLAYLRAACRWAWKVHHICDNDPASRMVLPKAARGRQVYLSRAQMLAIAQQMQDPRTQHHQHGQRRARAAMRVAFYSGMRLAEILRAQIITTTSGLDFVLATSKNDQPRHVPVHPRIAHIVRNRALWPIGLHPSVVSHYVKRAMVAAGLPHARLHDLRHSTASEMINAGVDLYTVGGVLGHKSTVSTQRYAHLATAKLRSALATVGQAPIGNKSRTSPLAKAA